MELPPTAFQKNVTVRLLSKSGKEFDRFEMRSGLNLWVFIRKRGHPIGAACSGVGVCAACAVTITPETAGSQAVSLQNEFEREGLIRHGHTIEKRLACLTRVFENISVQADYW